MLRRHFAVSVFVLVAAAAWAIEPGSGPSPPPSTEDALTRLLETMQVAVDIAPRSRVRLAGLAVEAEEAKVGAASSAPEIAWQREGIGPSFSRQPNSVDHLKLLKTFNAPWQWSAGNRVVEGSDLWLASESASVAYSEALTAGTDWLALAAAAEGAAVLRRRQEQLARALSIQERRFELGEVSGSELTQLRLAKVGESARFREQEVQVRLILGRLRERVESDEFDAGVGDLAALMHLEVAELPSESSLDSLVETSPAVVSAKLRANLEEATSRLVRRISWGRPAVEAEWQRVPDMGGIEGFDALGLQLAVPLPLGKGAQRTIAAAEARAAMASQRVELVRREVRSWLHNELATGQGAAQTLAELVPELEGLPRAREALTQQFALGAISYLVYLDGQARLDGVELQGVEARRALLRSRLSMALLLERESLFPIPSFNAEVEP